MIKHYLVVAYQKKEGCGHTIGCGVKLWEDTASNDEEFNAKLKEYLFDWWGPERCDELFKEIRVYCYDRSFSAPFSKWCHEEEKYKKEIESYKKEEEERKEIERLLKKYKEN